MNKKITRDELTAAVPDLSQPVALKGIDGPVAIFRDRFGIPHTLAQTVHDAFFGQGFAAAQDRLWHMDYDRRHAWGRLAEYLGGQALPEDRVMRRFQIGASAERDYAAVNTETRLMLEAYSAGVNAFIDGTKALPIEYRLLDAAPEPWRPMDSLAVFKVRHILMGVFEGKLWRARLVNTLGPERAAALLRGYPRDHLMIVPPGASYEGPVLQGLKELERNLQEIAWLREEPDSGSNNWAVHGSRTLSGKPLLAGDSHRPLDTPNAYYQNHIACPEFDVIGVSFPGCPGFPHFGHNARLAWCVTHAQADYQDLYLERFSPEDSTRYEFQGRWEKAEIKREPIRVRGEDPEEMEVPITRHGPIIAGEPRKGWGVAFRYTATAAPFLGLECFLPMLRASSVEELNESMRKWVDPCNNLVSADVHGNIAYLHRGQVPIRSSANAWLPIPGWTGEHEWRGNIPFEAMPRLQNPPGGFIVTANNRITGEGYPYFIALNYAPEYRARRIYERLKNLPRAAVEDMRAIHGDCISLPAQVLQEIIALAKPGDEFVARAQGLVSAWDGAMTRDAAAPAIYSAFRVRLLHRVVGNLVGPLVEEMFTAKGRGAPRHLSELASLLVSRAKERDTSLLPPGEDWTSAATRALNEAVADLRERLGDDLNAWRWGEIHLTAPQHPLSAIFPELKDTLDPPRVRMGGDGDTPLAAGYSPGNPFAVTLLSVVRYIFDTADWENSRWVVPLGASGHPGSGHYADQAPLWADLELIPMYYGWDKIKKEAASRQQLEPKKTNSKS